MLSVDWSLIVVFVIVWILLVILTKIFFNPLRKVVRDREEGIEGNRRAADKAIAEYEQILQKIEKDIKEAKTCASLTREKFEKEALKEKEKILSRVSQECQDQVREAKKELKQQVEALKHELDAESGLLAEKIEKRFLH